MKSLKDGRGVVDFLSTGSTLLNLSLSCKKHKVGGIPTRRITELSGAMASGKTYILGELCGNALRAGFTHVVVDDVEQRWDLTRLNIFGIEEKDKRFHYLYDSSTTLEDCFDVMFGKMDKLKRKHRMLYIVDPIAALNSKAETDPLKEMGKRAKVLQYRMRKLRDRMGDPDKDITVVLSNQLIDNLGVMFGPKKITPGGNALMHWPSVKIRFGPSKPLVETKRLNKKTKKIVNGVRVSATIPKNSEDDPFRESVFTIRYGYGIDDLYDCCVWLRDFTSVFGNSKDGYVYKKTKFKTVLQLINYVERKNLEDKVRKLTTKYYKLWYERSGERKERAF